MNRLTSKQNKLIFKEGNQEELKNLFRKYSITPELVKRWFKAELSNPCCSEPQLELVVLPDTRIAFHCLSCDTWRFRDRLNCSKKPSETEKPEEPPEPTSEPIKLNRQCVNCQSGSWVKLSQNRTSAIRCQTCGHLELAVFKK